MNPTSQSIKFILIHSKVFLVTIVVYLFFAMGILLVKEKFEFDSFLMILQVSLFLGVFLGGGLTSLKKSYLWKNNKKYKNSNLNAFFLIILVVNLLLVLIVYSHLRVLNLTLLVPFCVSIFASQMVIGKNILYKILIPALPLLLLALRGYGVGLNTIIVLIVAFTLMIIVSMYKNVFYSFGVNQGVENKSPANTVAFMTTGLNSTQLNVINAKIGIFIARWIQASKKQIDWAILMPHTRLTVIAMFYLLVIFVLVLLTGDEVHPILPIFFLMFLPMVMMGIIIEARHLIKQTKTFSHIYKGFNHRQLRNNILKALDKNLSANVMVYALGLFVIINMFSIAIFVKILITLLIFTYLLTLSIYPLFLCLNWINISFVLVVIMFSYVFTMYKSIKWVTANISLALTPQYIIAFVLVCLLLRALTQYLFWNRSIEALMRSR